VVPFKNAVFRVTTPLPVAKVIILALFRKSPCQVHPDELEGVPPGVVRRFHQVRRCHPGTQSTTDPTLAPNVIRTASLGIGTAPGTEP
jgi:hypothetical protein